MSRKGQYHLTDKIIREMTNSASYERGRAYQKMGMVLKGWITDIGIRGKVSGSYKPYYLVDITVKNSSEITGNCTCPVGSDCKHCVAVCLQYLYHPNSFLELKSTRIDGFGKEFINDMEKLIPKEMLKLDPISMNTFLDSLPLKNLKEKFLELWNYFAPETSKDIIDSEYPFNYWTLKLIETDEFHLYLKKKTIEKEDNIWFSPLKLLSYLKKTPFYHSLVDNWNIAYIKLGRYVQKIFKLLGITKEKITFDPDQYFAEFVYNDRWDNEYDDSIIIAEEFFSQFIKLFKELGYFYEILLNENMVESANMLFEYGVRWFLDLNLKKVEDIGLYELSCTQSKLWEQIDNLME